MNRPSLYSAIGLGEPICLDYEAALETLNQGIIIDEHGLLHWGSNYTFLVTVRHQDCSFVAIYKPRLGERPLWDFPDGTLCQRETASYVLSQMLGWDVVPPTALRNGPRGIGSVQIFINHDPERHYFTFDESHIEQVQRMAVFDMLVNNADRKGGHCLLDEADHIWGIDHGLTFHPAHKLRTVIWEFAGQRVPGSLMEQVQVLCEQLADEKDPLRQDLAGLLAENELAALRRRVERLLHTGVYPQPGPGPNRPWPAI